MNWCRPQRERWETEKTNKWKDEAMRKFWHVGINVTDMDKSIDFYRKVGFEVAQDKEIDAQFDSGRGCQPSWMGRSGNSENSRVLSISPEAYIKWRGLAALFSSVQPWWR